LAEVIIGEYNAKRKLKRNIAPSNRILKDLQKHADGNCYLCLYRA